MVHVDMTKKIAILFPGVRYSCDKPLLYYSKKVLEKNGYRVVGLDYKGLEGEALFQAFQQGSISNGAPDNRLTKENILSFVSKATSVIKGQMTEIDLHTFDKVVFVEKSIGAVIGGIYAKQIGIEPYHLMLTPIDYAFQFTEKSQGSVFVGTNDSLCNYEGIKKVSSERDWNFYSYKDCNHSLETGDIETDVNLMKRFVSTVGDIAADLERSIYDIQVLGRNQQQMTMSKYKGKVLLIVNTATGCGFTPQYQLLEELYERYQKDGFEILDFPSNQFAKQAPGTEEEIYTFCTARYDISFEQFAKICVNGDKQSELFGFLKARKVFKGFDMTKPDSNYLVRRLEKETPDFESTSDIKWNFTKFLVNRKGQVIERFEPTTDMEEVENAIKQLL